MHRTGGCGNYTDCSVHIRNHPYKMAVYPPLWRWAKLSCKANTYSARKVVRMCTDKYGWVRSLSAAKAAATTSIDMRIMLQYSRTAAELNLCWQANE